MLEKISVQDVFSLMDTNTPANEKYMIYKKFLRINEFLSDVEDLFANYFHTCNLELIDEILDSSDLNILEEE